MTRIPFDRAAALAAGFRTKKRLGQHLLRDASVAEATVAALNVGSGQALLEIGPGLGALTEGLLNLKVPLLAVEVDPSACRALRLKFGGDPNFHLLEGDVLEADLAAECALALDGRAFHVAANLPYYITTPVLAGLLESRLPFVRMVVLAQWEVALRLAARPGDKDWSALGALANYFCQVTLLRKVPRGAFTPIPGVDSGLVLFERRESPAVSAKDEALYFRLLRAGFGMRRKTLRRALLLSRLGLDAERLEGAFGACGLDGGRRGETLELAEWAALADALS
ncbi:MAG: 16S rRNA (adenine(1518)-N(6)/adenine(1519)-N(6))-dimethyltransferase RsmA [bacterium]